MKTSSAAPRKTSARNPAHFGSYRNPGPAGSSSASLASIGSMGGTIGNGDDMALAYRTVRQALQELSPMRSGVLCKRGRAVVRPQKPTGEMPRGFLGGSPVE